jgi:tRNA(Ile)-lysidine synthase
LKLPSLLAAVDHALRDSEALVSGRGMILGLSGGADSVALLDALVSLSSRHRLHVVVAHLDHGLRPDSAEDAAFCGRLCAGFGVPLHAAVADVSARVRREGGGLEQAARRERYRFLRRVREETGAAAIAVAHTRDDQAETLLMRLLRGAGATGLGGMRPRTGRLLRPLLEVSRQEVLAHLRDRGLEWREDPTNADLRHLRNRVRHELLPYLEARFNPALRTALARTAGLLAEEAAHLGREADALLGRIARRDGGCLVLDAAALASAPPAVARVAVRQALRRAGGLAGIRAVHVERTLGLARSRGSPGRRLPLPGRREVRYRHGELSLGPPRTEVAEGEARGRQT